MRQAWPWSARVLVMLRWNSGNCNVFVVKEWQARGYSFLMILVRFHTFDIEQTQRTVFVPVVADSVEINPELDESTNLLARRVVSFALSAMPGSLATPHIRNTLMRDSNRKGGKLRLSCICGACATACIAKISPENRFSQRTALDILAFPILYSIRTQNKSRSS